MIATILIDQPHLVLEFETIFVLYNPSRDYSSPFILCPIDTKVLHHVWQMVVYHSIFTRVVPSNGGLRKIQENSNMLYFDTLL